MQKTNYLTPKDLSDRFKIKKQKSYELFHREDFPSIRIGRKLLVREDKLLEWEENQLM
ncbi:MAG TPA: DNA-binding protein [Clostridiales bacterium]|nr:DNA-binding protein [Clostridiales bacterium]